MSKQAPPTVDLQAVACCSPIAVRPMDADQAALVAPMFKALGDPSPAATDVDDRLGAGGLRL